MILITEPFLSIFIFGFLFFFIRLKASTLVETLIPSTTLTISLFAIPQMSAGESLITPTTCGFMVVNKGGSKVMGMV